MQLKIETKEIPDVIEISNELIEEERPQIRERNNPTKRSTEDIPGPAFHEKQEKNL